MGELILILEPLQRGREGFLFFVFWCHTWVLGETGRWVLHAVWRPEGPQKTALGSLWHWLAVSVLRPVLQSPDYLSPSLDYLLETQSPCGTPEQHGLTEHHGVQGLEDRL